MTLEQALKGYFATKAQLAEIDASPPYGDDASKRVWVSAAASANASLVSAQQQLLAVIGRVAAAVMKGRSPQGWEAVDLASWSLNQFTVKWRPDKGPPESWIWTTITHKYISLWRSDRQMLSGEDETGPDMTLAVTAPEPEVTPDDLERVRKALDLLHSMLCASDHRTRDVNRQRYAFEQHSFWGISDVEIVFDETSPYWCGRKRDDELTSEDRKRVQRQKNLVRKHARRYAAMLQNLLGARAGELPRDLRNLLAERIVTTAAESTVRPCPVHAEGIAVRIHDPAIGCKGRLRSRAGTPADAPAIGSGVSRWPGRRRPSESRQTKETSS